MNYRVCIAWCITALLLLNGGCSKNENPVDTGGGGGSGGGGGVNPPVSGLAASIVLVKQSSQTIALKGTGKNESCTLTFEVRDSTGAPMIDSVLTVLVKFSLSAGPGGGEFVSPALAYTNHSTGQVSTTVTSGTLPGALQVIASTRGDTVKTSPTFLAMGAGLPDSAGVSVGATKLNIAGRVYGNLRTTINVAVGDRFGSPVAEGTMISFKTDPVARLAAFSAMTNKEGNATVDLISTTNFLANSLVQVVAATMGDKSYRASDSLIERSMYILFSGPTAVPGRGANSFNFTVPDGETRSFDFTVSDDRGMPLVAGTKIKITMTASDTIKNDLELLFGTNGTYTMPDVNLPGPNRTQFSAGVLDKGTTKIPGFITFGIEITSPEDGNGNYVNPNWFSGYVSAGGGGIFNLPSTIELADTSVSTLYLAETALPGITGRIYFVVKDALGNAITLPTRSRVDFSLVSAPTGVTLSKTFDTTNASGLVYVDINAGNYPGTAQVAAQILGVDGLVTAYSRAIEVAHGLPDSNRISISLSKKNMFNNIGSPVGTVNLSLSDSYGYYAAPQRYASDIVLSSTGGWVTPVPTTVGGKTSVTLNGGLPEPSDPIRGPGFGYVNGTFRVSGAATAVRSALFLFSYAPEIAFTNPALIDTTSGVLLSSIADGSSVDIDFAVWDKNRNPISSGNTISVTTGGPIASEIVVTGDVDVESLPDTQDPLLTRYRIRIADKDNGSGGQGAFNVTIKVSGESGIVTRTLSGYLLAPNVLGGNTSGYAKTFELLTPESKRTIFVRGSGGSGTGRPETATLEFVAKDSLGRAVDSDHSVTMRFAFQGYTFGATIERDSGITDADGKFTMVVRSGTESGVPYVYAYSVVNGDTIKSGLVGIIVCSGFTDPNRFSVSTQYLNFPGLDMDGLTDRIRVQLADVYGNPVPIGTPAHFYCTHGAVQTQAAYSDINGIITQLHYSNGDRPQLADALPEGEGFVYVKVRTMGEGGLDIWDSVRVLWSGHPVSPYTWTVYRDLPTTPVAQIPDTFTVPHLGSAGPWYFEIRDRLGNPLAGETTITVDGGSAVVVVGDESVRLPDTQAGHNNTPASGITNFVVALQDAHDPSATAEQKSVILRVIVNSPTYGQYSFVLATGTVF